MTTAQTKQRDSDRQLSGALMAGAFALMCVVFASAPAAFPNLTAWGRGMGAMIAFVAIASYGTSVFFGGRGWTASTPGGPGRYFNLQALAGICGIVFHALMLAVVAITGVHPVDQRSFDQVTREVAEVKADLRALRHDVKARQPSRGPELRVICEASAPATCIVK